MFTQKLRDQKLKIQMKKEELVQKTEHKTK